MVLSELKHVTLLYPPDPGHCSQRRCQTPQPELAPQCEWYDQRRGEILLSAKPAVSLPQSAPLGELHIK